MKRTVFASCRCNRSRRCRCMGADIYTNGVEARHSECKGDPRRLAVRRD
jgi:hypothetical protein